MKHYKYELERGSKHIICPNCGKKTFKCYVDANTGERINPAKYGKCERISSCRYHLYPKLGNDDIYSSSYVPPAPEKIKPLDFVDKDLVQATFNEFKSNVFFMYLVKLFGITKAYELQEIYNIGTAKNNGTIYWQQDKEGNFRTGKVMYYGANGKRLKDKNSWYIHRRIKEDFELQQVFFGEHLLSINEYKDKPIALCESEKTAVIMSEFMPEYVWLASGGANMLNSFRLLRLHRLDKVFPDNGQFELWEQKTKIFNNRSMDISVDSAVRNGIIKEGADILDLWMKEKVIKMKSHAN